jgi:hypothetical protein
MFNNSPLLQQRKEHKNPGCRQLVHHRIKGNDLINLMFGIKFVVSIEDNLANLVFIV